MNALTLPILLSLGPAVAQDIVEPNRIALTPVIDGTIGTDEWDAFAQIESATAYFQWEPNRFHVAASGVGDQDLVLSVDFGANGWLVGRDNYEFKIQPATGKVAVRLLDATNVEGPVWIPIGGFETSSKVSGSNGTIEATIVDPGLGILPDQPGKKPNVRVDFAPAGGVEAQAFLPRVLSSVSLGYWRATALPSGLKFKPEGDGRTVVPGQPLKIRYTFEGKNVTGLRRISLGSEGPAKDFTNFIEMPFPAFDNKNRAFVDYDTGVKAGASEGFRLSRGSLSTADGIPGIIQVSYRIAPVLDADLIRQDYRRSDTDRSYKASIYFRSNSATSVGAKVKMRLAEPLRLLNGTERDLIINSRRGTSRQTIEFYVPGNTTGTFPLEFEFETRGGTYKQTQYITIR